MSEIRVALLGMSGRMGRAIMSVLSEAQDMKLVGATASVNSEWLGKDAGLATGTACNVVVGADPAAAVANADVAIDFSVPAALAANLAACLQARCPLVIGTTGLGATEHGQIAQAAQQIPILVSPNMSLGVNLLLQLVATAARALDAERYDIEIFEAHHRHKRDAPSGTALKIGEAVAAARGTTLSQAADFERSRSNAPRTSGTIGFSVARGGEIVGDHVVMFAGPGERLEIAHRAQDRAAFAQGAVQAARWLVGRSPGEYSMQDVLGI